MSKNKKHINSSTLNDAVKEVEFITKRQAIIQNSYYRRYYIKNNVRVTLDDNLKFSLPLSNVYKNSKYCVMEVKYKTEFISLFNLEEEKMGLVVTFLAILELMKESLIEIVQTNPYGTIHIKALLSENKD